MDMPGSTKHLDELMSRVMGDLVESGIVARLADDLYTGGRSIAELLHNWERILQRFEANNLQLSASKAVICPASTVILGWVWSKGHIRASPHKVSPLVSADPPKTIKGLHSWIGVCRHLRPCLPQHATLLNDLKAVIRGQESRTRIQWFDNLLQSFTQRSLLCTISNPSRSPDLKTNSSLQMMRGHERDRSCTLHLKGQ